MDNRTVVQRMFDEVVNAGNLDAIDELFDEDFQSRTPQGDLDRSGFRDYVAGWRAGFPDVKCEVLDVVAEGDRLAWRIRSTGTHTGDFMGIPATGRSIDFDSLNIATFRDGRGYRHQMIMDTGQVMAQLGLGPGPA
jgi:predicted ester cyclase